MRLARRRALAVGSVAVFAFILLGAIGGSAYLLWSSNPSSPSAPQELGPGVTYRDGAVTAQMHINVAVNVTVTKSAADNSVVASVYQPHDLITNNFFTYMKAMFLNVVSGGTVSATLADTSNTGRTAQVWSPLCSSSCYQGFGADVGAGGQFEVGTSATAPARTDYQLNAPYQTFFTATSSACSVGAGSSSFTVSGSENAQSGATITEVGLFDQLMYATGGAGTMQEFLFAHDTFSGVAVTSANVITVVETWTLNSAGINRNFCFWLSSFFSNDNFGTGAGFGSGSASSNTREPIPLDTLYATIGANVTYAVHCPDSYYGNISPLTYLDSSSPSASSCGPAAGDAQTNYANNIYVAVGTGSTPFTPSSTALTTFNHQAVDTLTTYDGAGNLFITGANVLSSSATISEAALYITMPQSCEGYSPHASSNAGSCTGGYTTLTTMWFAVTFTGVAVSGSNPIGVYFELSG